MVLTCIEVVIDEEGGVSTISKVRRVEIATPYPEGSVNAYILLGHPITLVDTGIRRPSGVMSIRCALQEEELSLQDIEQIIVTHMHVDHSGGVVEIQREVDVPVFVHERARPFLEGGIETFQRMEAYFQTFFSACQASGVSRRKRTYQEERWKRIHYLSDGDVLSAGEAAYQVLYVPGHSQTDICLFDERTGDAFVGDHLLRDISANAFIEPPAPNEVARPKPLIQYRSSMERTEKLPIQRVYPGHGEPYVGHMDVIHKRFAEQEKRCHDIVKVLEQGEMSVFQLSQALFPRLEGEAIFLGLSEVQGHLDLMLERNWVEEHQVDEKMWYALK